jgi:hypothetical protein
MEIEIMETNNKNRAKNNKRQTHAAYSIGQASRISMQIDGPVHGEGCNVT